MACVNCKTNDPCDLHAQVCSCARLDCWHPYGRCDEPPKRRGGQCQTCHDYSPKRCPTCGRPMPEESK